MKNLKLATVNFTLPKTKYLLLQTIILYLVSVVFSPLFFSGCTAENEQKISKDISAENRTELLQKAVELTKEKNFGQAEIIFQRIINQKSDYQLFYFWAKLKIAENDLPAAITKFRKASMLTRKPQIWLELLKFEMETVNEFFPNDYHKFLEFAGKKDKLTAREYYRIWRNRH